jgi:tRNA pseudouridine55 synthase
MSRRKAPTGPGGLVILNKEAGLTSHDVVAAVRRIVGTRRVGHAGTLDPMATGVLVLGVERGTKLLTHLSLTDKTYLATIRLGQSSSTDDAEGELGPAMAVGDLDQSELGLALAKFTGVISQRPSDVSAIKVDGQRAYALVRAGQAVELAERTVTVDRFELTAPPQRTGPFVDLAVTVTCSSGTYVRALARDLGQTLGVGGHLTRLHRSRVGVFDLSAALSLAELAALVSQENRLPLPLPDAIAAFMPTRAVTVEEATELTYGRSIGTAGIEGEYGALDSTGAAVALLRESHGRANPTLGFMARG